jgi:hypothetical protein
MESKSHWNIQAFDSLKVQFDYEFGRQRGRSSQMGLHMNAAMIHYCCTTRKERDEMYARLHLAMARSAMDGHSVMYHARQIYKENASAIAAAERDAVGRSVGEVLSEGRDAASPSPKARPTRRAPQNRQRRQRR